MRSSARRLDRLERPVSSQVVLGRDVYPRPEGGHQTLSLARRRLANLTVVGLLVSVLAAGVHGQSSDANLYKEALTREAALRDELSALRPGETPAPVVQRIRVMVGAYEDIARLFPAGEYSDNALWQGGVLAADLFVRFGDVEDRDAAQRLLHTRSEERRVGKECRSRWSPYH